MSDQEQGVSGSIESEDECLFERDSGRVRDKEVSNDKFLISKFLTYFFKVKTLYHPENGIITIIEFVNC